MFKHNPALGSMPFAERNEVVGMSPTALPWYLIRTKSGKEQYVHRELSRRLPETFMPMLESRSRRKSVSLVPLFPQYLFARLELAAHYFEIRYMPGVVGFISTGGELLAVAQTIVDNIRSRCRDGVVQIFEGYLSGSKRVAILITTVEGCGVRVVADAASIAI
jgi:transcription antitermination factor NusG